MCSKDAIEHKEEGSSTAIIEHMHYMHEKKPNDSCMSFIKSILCYLFLCHSPSKATDYPRCFPFSRTTAFLRLNRKMEIFHWVFFSFVMNIDKCVSIVNGFWKMGFFIRKIEIFCAGHAGN